MWHEGEAAQAVQDASEKRLEGIAAGQVQHDPSRRANLRSGLGRCDESRQRFPAAPGRPDPPGDLPERIGAGVRRPGRFDGIVEGSGATRSHTKFQQGLRVNCCDDTAVGAGADQLSYAESLLHPAKRSHSLPQPSRIDATLP